MKMKYKYTKKTNKNEKAVLYVLLHYQIRQY